MSTDNHTPIPTSQTQITRASINGPLGQLDAAIESVGAVAHTENESLTAVVSAGFLSVNTEIAELNAAYVDFDERAEVLEATTNAGLNADGTVKAGRVGADAIATSGVSATSQLGDRIVTAGKLATDAVTPVNFIRDSHNRFLKAGVNDGSIRWRMSTLGVQVATTILNDVNNPYGAPTVRMPGDSTERFIGKRQTLAESGVKVGDKITGAIECRALSGTFRARWYFYSSSTSFTATSGSYTTMNGTVQTLITAVGTIPAGTIAIELILEREVGTTTDIDAYAWGGTKGEYPPTLTALGTINPPIGALPNILSDAYFQYLRVGMNFSGRPRWWEPQNLTIKNDGANPFGGRYLQFAASWLGFNRAGLIFPLDELKLKTGDVATPAAYVGIPAGSDPGSWRMRIGALDALGTTYVGSQLANFAVTVNDGDVALMTAPAFTIPATAKYLVIFWAQETASVPLNIYKLWANEGPVVSTTPAPPSQDAETAWMAHAPLIRGGFNRAALTNWDTALAKIELATGSATWVAIGDSNTEQNNLTVPTLAKLRALYPNDRGPGWIGLGNNRGNTLIPAPGGTPLWTFARTGTWASGDVDEGAARGIDLTESTGNDISTPGLYSVVTTATLFRIHYLAKSGGGSFQWRVDGGAWSSNVSTAAGSDGYTAYAPTGLAGLGATAHTIEIKVTVAGSSGVTPLALEAIRTDQGNGINFYNLGNSGTEVADWVAPGAALWQSGLATLAPNLITIMLKTNDKSANANPLTYATNLTTLIGRCRAAVPGVSIVLVAPPASGTTATFEDYDYVDAMHRVAYELDCAFFSLWETFSKGDYPTTLALGIMNADLLHLTALGGRKAAVEFSRFLLGY